MGYLNGANNYRGNGGIMSKYTEIIEYYRDLLAYQYINAPTAQNTISLLVSCAVCDLLPSDVNNAFDLDTAVGDQLDILGEYIGFDRVVKAPINRDYFTLQDYSDPLGEYFGFTKYSDTTTNVSSSMFLYVFFETPANSLEDSEYRTLLKLKCLMNISKYSTYDINTLLFSFFGNNVFCGDQLDMSINYFVKPEYSRLMSIALAENLLPKPMGVLITSLTELDDFNNLWAFDSYESLSGSTLGFSNYLTGFLDGHVLQYGDIIE